MIVIIDFGSQTAHLISRRLSDMSVDSKLVDPQDALKEITDNHAEGIILSGGPASVFESGAPTIDKSVFDLKIPVLGICYGWQLMAYLLQGHVEAGRKEYGPKKLTICEFSDFFYGLPDETQVFESHGTTVYELPPGFEVTGSTDADANAAVKNSDKKFFGVQFHPEVQHTRHGKQMLKNFVTRICNVGIKPKSIDTDGMIAEIKAKVGKSRVIGAFSGGTDSSVAGTLVARAIGKRFIPVYIDSGLVRDEATQRVHTIFPKILGVPIRIVDARKEFLTALKGVTDPEQKRKVIGRMYIELFDRVASEYPDAVFLLQGTTYADFIHSKGSKRSALIKSHHNVGGLPENMKLKLLEPIRYYYTDQVRKIGLKLGLPKNIVFQQPFPGPGHAVRIIGEITEMRLSKQKLADAIVVEELKKVGWYEKVFQCWSVLTGLKSTAVKGDERAYAEVIAVRIISTKDRMSVDWVYLPKHVYAAISTRIVNEVPDVSRVVYDITTKPPATMEWE